MLINVLLHISAFRFAAKELIARAHFVDDISFYGLFLTFPFVTLQNLARKKCDLIEKDRDSRILLDFCIVLSGAVFVVAMLILWRKFDWSFDPRSGRE